MEDLKKRKQEYWDLVSAQGSELIEIFNLYGNCKHCEHSLCCKINPPNLFEDDIPKISQFLKMSEKEFLDKYVYQYKIKGLGMDEKGFIINNIPCPFLDEKNKCTIYPVRPFSCRFFPFQPALDEICLEGIELCPTATLMASEFWEYHTNIVKSISQREFETSREHMEYFESKQKFLDEMKKPLEEFYNLLGINDIAMQNYIDTYITPVFLEAMTYFNRY